MQRMIEGYFLHLNTRLERPRLFIMVMVMVMMMMMMIDENSVPLRSSASYRDDC